MPRGEERLFWVCFFRARNRCAPRNTPKAMNLVHGSPVLSALTLPAAAGEGSRSIARPPPDTHRSLRKPQIAG